jgi:peptide chain release factor 2
LIQLGTISKRYGGVFDPDKMDASIKILEASTAQANFWNDRKNAENILLQLNTIKRKLENWQSLHTDYSELKEFYELALKEKDQSLEQEIRENLKQIEARFIQYKIEEFFKDKHDPSSAFLTIHSGAGGTEACDWVSMLLRMYTRWAEEHDYKVEIIDILEAEGGIKSVTLEIKGEYVYGYLKCESGIHRLVRISPFDSNKRRHTSFASVFCSPVLNEDIEIVIQPDDLRIDTFRAAGAGGQHVNKTDSAVRITHISTGIVVQCQNERSQHKNKATALKVLKSRLYEHQKEERDKEKQKIEESKKDISWGNQIRSYVFQPYNLVKDHRTKYEMGNVQAVMDGRIDPFIEEYLNYLWQNRS